MTSSEAHVPAPHITAFLESQRDALVSAWSEAAGEQPPQESPADPREWLPVIIQDVAGCLSLKGRPLVLSESGRSVLRNVAATPDFKLASALHGCTLLRRVLLRAWLRCTAGAERDGGVEVLDEILEALTLGFIEESSALQQKTFHALDLISSAALRSDSLDGLLQHLVAIVCEAVPGADSVAILLRDGEWLQVRAAVGLGPEEMEFRERMADGFAGSIAQGRRPLVVHDASKSPLVHSPALRARGLRALYGVPLLSGERVVGVAHIGSTSLRDFPQPAKLLFSVMAARAAEAIVQHQLKETLEREREDFINVLVHDLKTPLGTILGMAYLALRHLEGSAERATVERLRKIQTQVDRMQRLLNDFLDIRMISTGRMAIHPTRLEYGPFVAELVEEWQAAAPNHRLECHIEEGIVVEADAGRLTQVLNNLLSNAIKYSPSGGCVRVSAVVKPDGVLTSVEDEGIGIPAEELPHVFERYARGTTGRVQAHGHGIGLFSSAALVRAQGGRMWAESELGKGSTFYFSLRGGAAGSVPLRH